MQTLRAQLQQAQEDLAAVTAQKAKVSRTCRVGTRVWVNQDLFGMVLGLRMQLRKSCETGAP